MKSNDLISYLDEFLKIREIDDYSCNGLQIEGGNTIEKVALAVDFCIESAKGAARLGADLLMVHHGLIWEGLKNIRGETYRRIKAMMVSGTGLYAAHLPLDLHPEVGNNVELARLLKIKMCGTFAPAKGKDLGVWGEFETPMDLDSLHNLIATALGTECSLLPFGKEHIKTIGIVSGGGTSHVKDAIEKGLDVFLTGEIGHTVYHAARENNLTIISAGHYATETLGLRALGHHIQEKFGLVVHFVDVPTGL